MCTLTLQAELSDGRVPVSITVDPALPGNRFRNLNSGQSYPFPTFVNNSGVLEVLRGCPFPGRQPRHGALYGMGDTLLGHNPDGRQAGTCA